MEERWILDLGISGWYNGLFTNLCIDCEKKFFIYLFFDIGNFMFLFFFSFGLGARITGEDAR